MVMMMGVKWGLWSVNAPAFGLNSCWLIKRFYDEDWTETGLNWFEQVDNKRFHEIENYQKNLGFDIKMRMIW